MRKCGEKRLCGKGGRLPSPLREGRKACEINTGEGGSGLKEGLCEGGGGGETSYGRWCGNSVFETEVKTHMGESGVSSGVGAGGICCMILAPSAPG